MLYGSVAGKTSRHNWKVSISLHSACNSQDSQFIRGAPGVSRASYLISENNNDSTYVRPNWEVHCTLFWWVIDLRQDRGYMTTECRGMMRAIQFPSMDSHLQTAVFFCKPKLGQAPKALVQLASAAK
jgi:hypothetical protein